MSRISLFAIICLCAASTHGATVVWTNTLGGDWGVAENWSPNQLPGTSDTALITNNGNYAVIADINPSVSNLVVGGESGTQTLVKTNGQLTIHKPSDIGSRGVLNLSATLVSTGLTVHGTLNWSGGSIANGSSVAVATNGLLNLIGAATKGLPGLLTNQGTIIFTGEGALNTGGSGTLRNLSGGLVDFQTNATLGGSAPVVNNGTIRKSSNLGSVSVTVPCTNYGVVEVQSGSIGFGQFILGQLTLGDGSSYTGPGLVVLNNGGTLRGSISSENLILLSGTVNGSGTLHGSLIWSNGMTSASSMLTVASDGVSSLVGSSPKTLQGSITNDGVITWTNGQISLSAGVVIHNRTGGVIDLQSVIPISAQLGSQLINDGIMRKTAGAGTTSIGSGTVINNGTIDCQIGVFSFSKVVMGEGCSFIGAGTNALRSGTMNGSFNSENLSFSGLTGDTLDGDGTLNGYLIWSGGSIVDGASLTITSNSTLRIGRNSFFSVGPLTISGALTNAGTIICSKDLISASIQVATSGSSGVIRNLDGALLEGDNIRFMRSGAGGVGIINDGVLKTSEGMALDLPVNNRGTMEASSGTISMSGGVTIGDGSSYIGAGTNQITGSAGPTTLAGDFTSENLRWDNQAHLKESGTLHGSAVWQSAYIDPGASLTVASDGVLNVTGSASVMSLSGSLTNAGIVNWNSSDYLSGLGVLHNLQNGLFDIQSNGGMLVASALRFINDGTFRKSNGTGTNTMHALVVFTNNGIVSVQTGAIRFDGSLFNPAGTLEVQGGRISFAVPLILTNGLITGSGIVEAPSITSAATVNPGATNAVLTISGNYTQQLAGTLEFDIAGTEPGTSHSQVIITGDAELSGTVGIRFAPGYSPDVGDSNVVFTAASLSGDFDCFNGFLILGENNRLVRSYSSTNMVLTTIAAPDPVSPTLNISKGDQVLICWPSEFTGYTLYTNDDLGSTNWVAVTGATNRFLEMPTSPLKFFGLFEE